MESNKYYAGALLTITAISRAHADLLWMSDGSEVVFQDTVKITEASIPGGGQSYEGAVDPVVIYGSYQLPIDQQAYVSTEAEWVLLLPDHHSGRIDSDTPVILQGMVDGKYFAQFKQDQTHWLPASLGNNLIASGTGISTTIAELSQGGLHAQIEVGYVDAAGKPQIFTSNSDSLTGLPLLNLVNGVLAREPDATAVNLGAIEPSSALVNDDGIRASAILKSIFELPFSGLPICLDSLKQLTLKNISEIVIKHQKYMNQEAYIRVSDGSGNEVGFGYLSLRQ